MPTTFIPGDSIDRLIADRLPAWLTDTDVDQLRALHSAIRTEQQAAAQVASHFKALPSIEAFATPLLVHALREAGIAQPDIRGMKVEIEQVIELPSAAPRLLVNRLTYRSRRSLLAAALHNFDEQELAPDLFRQAWLIDVDGSRLALSFERFARCCRQLDLGGRYQQLLTRVLAPKTRPTAPPGSGAQAVEQLLERNVRAQLEVAMRLARLKGALETFDYHRLQPHWAKTPIVQPVQGSATPRQLYLLGKCIRGVVAFEQRAHVEGAARSITLWVPRDPETPVSQHASWEALYQWLGQRLRDERYPRFFARFISERDRPAFLQTLMHLRSASASGAPLMLDGRNFAVEGPLLSHLRMLQIGKMRDDARVLAVPTADEDMASRHLRLQASLNAGLDLLNLAALFVPGLGEIMLVVTAVQIASQVYEGYEDWQLGDREGALEHLFGVAECVVLGAASTAVGLTALSALRRVTFVDGLTPASGAAGQIYLRNDGESMHHVADPGELIRRLGPPLVDAPDWHAQALLHTTGLKPEHVRRLHLEQAGPLARVLDAHERIELHQQLPALRGSALETELARRQPAVSPAQAPLLRAFPSLSQRQAEEILEHGSTLQIDAMQATGRVPLALAEQARWAIRDARLDRACLGLQLAQAVTADTEHLAIGLLERAAPWPDDVRVEIRDGSATGPVVAATRRRLATQVRVIVREAEGYLASAAPSAQSSGSLWQALLEHLEPGQKQALGNPALSDEQLRQWLAEQAAADRQRCADVLGMAPVGTGLRPPIRLADGRLGYPLSGRLPGGRQPLRSGLHRIFPTLEGEQLDRYVFDLLDRHVNLWQHCAQLNETLARLNQALQQWRSEVGLIASFRRRRVATQLRRCWRRKLTNYAGDYVLVIDGERVGHLPQLPPGVDFSHVSRLVLRNMALSSIDADFLGRFSQLTELDLRRNQLTQIPPGLDQLSRLRQLRLSRNQIVMTAEGNQQLLALTRLHVLDLSHNPLGRLPELVELDSLTHVRLRDTGVQDLPDLTDALPWRAHLDLRDNRIRQVRQDILSLWHNLHRVGLHDNPLDAASANALDRLSGASDSSARASVSYEHNPTHEALLDYWIGSPSVLERSRRTQLWNELREQEDSSDLFRFLADFVSTEDFAQQQDHYQGRVWQMLEAAHAHEALRTRLFETAAGERTCDDRLLLIMSQLELSVMAERALIDGPAEEVEGRLLALDRSLFRVDALDAIATRHIARLHAAKLPLVDEIEVRLYFRVKLRRVLDLPATPEDMHYEDFAPVTTSDLRHAAREVLAMENAETLSASLAQRPFWEAYVRHHAAARFEALAQPFYQRLEALEADSISSAQWLESSNRLKEELEVAERTLIRTLAEEAYARAAAR